MHPVAGLDAGLYGLRGSSGRWSRIRPYARQDHFNPSHTTRSLTNCRRRPNSRFRAELMLPFIPSASLPCMVAVTEAATRSQWV